MSKTETAPNQETAQMSTKTSEIDEKNYLDQYEKSPESFALSGSSSPWLWPFGSKDKLNVKIENVEIRRNKSGNGFHVRIHSADNTCLGNKAIVDEFLKAGKNPIKVEIRPQSLSEYETNVQTILAKDADERTRAERNVVSNYQSKGLVGSYNANSQKLAVIA